MSRTKGYKCSNVYCGSCIGKSLCGEPGDSPLQCADRLAPGPTNADHIRTMSDEELAEFLCHFRSDDAETCSGCKSEHYCRPGHNGMIDWLQQPAEEGK